MVAVARPRAEKKAGYHHGDLRRALLDAALSLVHKKGTEGLSLREVARAVGVTQAAPYHHFKDKEGLLAAVAEEGFHTLRKAMTAAAGHHPDDAIERLKAMGGAYIRVAVKNPAHFKVMFGGALCNFGEHPSLMEAAQSTFALLVEGVASCAADARVSAPEPPCDLAIVMWANVHGLASLWIDGPLQRKAGIDKTIEQLSHLVNDVLARALMRAQIGRAHV